MTRLHDDDAAALRRELVSKLPEKSDNPLFVILVGLPGSGKSYFAEELASRIPLIVLSSDFTRKLLIKKPVYTQREHDRVFSVLYYLAREYLSQGYSVVFDATNLNKKYRRPLGAIAQETGAVAVNVFLNTPRNTARKRLKNRLSGYSDADWEVYQMLESEFEPLSGHYYDIKPDMDIGPIIDRIIGDIKAKRT